MVICPDARRPSPTRCSRPTWSARWSRTARTSAGSRSSTRPDEDDDVDLLAWRNTNLSSTYAAMYAPHLRIVNLDPDSIDRFATVPPSGFVAGVFARTDRLRGRAQGPGQRDGHRHRRAVARPTPSAARTCSTRAAST